MKILILGATGFLGKKLMTDLSKNHEVVGTCHKENIPGLYNIDALDFVGLKEFILNIKPQVIIDTIALTSSLECERNPDLAKQLNYQTASNIVSVSNLVGAKLVFISSSYVFDGSKGNYSEEDMPNPTNVYGKTKVLAEKEVLESNGIVLRVDIMYGYNGKNNNNGIFGKIIASNTLEERNPAQLRCPLFVDDVSSAITTLIEKNQSGIFHLCGPDKITIYDFQKKLESIIRKESIIKVINDPHAKIRPPMDTTLNLKKVNKLGIKTTNLEEGLAKLKKQFKS